MENSNDIMELLDLLYGMVNEAWGVPLGNDKCIIEREKAIEIINDIKAGLPASIAESRRLVSARDEFVGNARREADAVKKNAEEEAARLLDEQEIVKAAREKSEAMIRAAEKKSSELRRVASEYVDSLMRETEQSLNNALTGIRNTQSAFKFNSSAAEVEAAAGQQKAKQEPEQETEKKKDDKPAILKDLPLEIEDEDGWLRK